MARTRFGRDLSVAIAFSLAIIAIRTLAYTLVVLVQYPTAEATGYFAASSASVVAAWIALTTFSLYQLQIRTQIGRFLHGVRNAGRYQVSWIVQAVVWRIPSIAMIGYLVVLQGAGVVRSQNPISSFSVFGLCLVAVGLASVGLIHRVSRKLHTELKGVPEIVTAVIAALAIGGPDFRIDQGVIHPVYFGVVLDDTSAFLFLLLPSAITLTLAAQMLGARMRTRARRRTWSAVSRVPLFAAFLRNQSIGILMAIAVLSLLLSIALPRLVAATAAAAAATMPWILKSARYLRIIRDEWRIDGPLSSLVRQSRQVALIGLAAYSLLALGFVWWV